MDLLSRLYHRKDGRVMKEGDDLLSATRYAVMMLRYAETIYQPPRPRPFRRDTQFSRMGACAISAATRRL